jgi:SAM-dependent methyltransferase
MAVRASWATQISCAQDWKSAAPNAQLHRSRRIHTIGNVAGHGRISRPLGAEMVSLSKKLRTFVGPCVKAFVARHGYRLVSDYRAYQSETSKCRERLAPFCIGYGADLGFGGDPISDAAVRIDYPNPYAHTGMYPVQLGGDASRLHWFADGVLDYIYSSHLLEDFQDTKGILIEWLRVLKPGGHLILFCPDQQVYKAYCRTHGKEPNPHHAHADFSLRKVQQILSEIDATEEIHSRDIVDDYSWELVVAKRT